MNLKFPKLQFQLKIFLRILFSVILALELVVLYQTLFLYPGSESGSPGETSQKAAAKVNLNVLQFTQVYNWTGERENFVLPTYDLKSDSGGRENPFADYK